MVNADAEAERWREISLVDGDSLEVRRPRHADGKEHLIEDKTGVGEAEAPGPQRQARSKAVAEADQSQDGCVDDQDGRSPTRSMSRPSAGLKTIPSTDETTHSLAMVDAGSPKTWTSTHGANVINTCLRAPKRTHIV